MIRPNSELQPTASVPTQSYVSWEVVIMTVDLFASTGQLSAVQHCVALGLGIYPIITYSCLSLLCSAQVIFQPVFKRSCKTDWSRIFVFWEIY